MLPWPEYPHFIASLQLQILIGKITEADRVLLPAPVRWTGLRRVAAHEVRGVRISTKDDVRRHQRAEAIQAISHHGIAVGDLHECSAAAVTPAAVVLMPTRRSSPS
jgi:hypothetical protein